MTNYVDTHSGRQINLDAPSPDDIDIRDIACGLAKLCRFGAQAAEFYSVAQHSLYVMHTVVDVLERPDLALAALHHDSAEAYIGDLPTPVKRQLAGSGSNETPSYKRLSDRFDRAIAEAAGFAAPSEDDHQTIKRADLAALMTEAAILMPRSARKIIGQVRSGLPGIQPAPSRGFETPLSHEDAGNSFLAAHEQLVG